jgi:hypothetical protein
VREVHQLKDITLDGHPWMSDVRPVQIDDTSRQFSLLNAAGQPDPQRGTRRAR